MQLDRAWRPFVDGAFVDASGDEQLTVENPATAGTLATVQAGTASDVDAAVDSARSAFESWRGVPPADRADRLRETGRAIEDHHDELVALEVAENGKPRDQAVIDVSKAASYFRFYGGGADKFYGETVRNSPDAVYKKIYEPYGVVGIMIPWNWPPLHTAQFAAMALATGNAVVIKPAPETPLSSLRLAEIMGSVLPDGVCNVVPGGTDPGVALTSHRDVDKLSFTGNDETGEKVLEAAASGITPVMLELGGKNPEIVFPDADLDQAVDTAVVNGFYNSGQACSDTERLLLHESIKDEFLDRFADAVGALVVGDGTDEATQVGPMINESQQDKARSYLDRAESEGATRIAQADLPTDPELSDGYWVAPTVFDGVEPDMRLATEEVFGPVVGVMTFESEREAVEIANDVDFGLTATVWTTDLERAHGVANRLEAGTVAINNRTVGAHGMAFGGYKRSGIGRKSDFKESMEEFAQVKSIHMDFTDEAPSL
jgi:aldehyde dehydrogenase (NAD+)